MGRTRSQIWARRFVGIAVMLVISAILLFVARQIAQNWTPDRGHYPMQGIVVSSENGPVAWSTIAAMDADFAYILASTGSDQRDTRFTENFAGAASAGLRHGALHRYTLCRLASDQAEIFVTTVPRNPEALPPAVSLEFGDDCADRPRRALVISELQTFLNQIENHSGKPTVLRISPEFEAHYAISSALNRTIWLTGSYFPPDYASKPWVMWEANSARTMPGVKTPISWNVVRP